MKICYHGTDEKNAQSILKEGFRPKSWFSRHLEDAIDKGGTHVFQVAFDDPPNSWQFWLKETWIKPDRIVGYTVYQVEQKTDNEKLREEVLKSPKIPPNRAAKWRSFDYSKWKELDDKFDHTTWDRLLDESFESSDGEVISSDAMKWIDNLLGSLDKAQKECDGRPPFRPNALYVADGDILEVYLSDEESYCKWLNPQLTVILDLETDEVVGFQIWGMSHVLKEHIEAIQNKWDLAKKCIEREKDF